MRIYEHFIKRLYNRSNDFKWTTERQRQQPINEQYSHNQTTSTMPVSVYAPKYTLYVMQQLKSGSTENEKFTFTPWIHQIENTWLNKTPKIFFATSINFFLSSICLNGQYFTDTHWVEIFDNWSDINHSIWVFSDEQI